MDQKNIVYRFQNNVLVVELQLRENTQLSNDIEDPNGMLAFQMQLLLQNLAKGKSLNAIEMRHFNT